jgi:hypothetical protein
VGPAVPLDRSSHGQRHSDPSRQTQVINEHALEATGGKTYAALEQDDPVRDTAMLASFLRASLFSSVVAYGVALMAMGVGVALILIGLALSSVAKAATSGAVKHL